MRISCPSFAGLLATSIFALAASCPYALALSSPIMGHGTESFSKAQEYDGPNGQSNCHGGNKSPAISWAQLPPGTQSLALTLYDPDAQNGRGWWHWLAIDLPINISRLPENSSNHTMPRGALETRNSFGNSGYGGACPPLGDPPHHYILTLYALKTATLPALTADSDPQTVVQTIQNNALTHTSITATYSR